MGLFSFLLVLTHFAMADFGYETLKDSEVLTSFPNTHINQKIDPNNIEILVWNIYKAQKPNLYTDLLFLSENKSLVLLQEGENTNAFSQFAEHSNKLYWLMAGSFKKEDGIKTGVITGFKDLPTSTFFIRSPDTEPITNTPKMILGSIFEIQNNVNLLVLNIHGINFVSNHSFRRQIFAAAEAIKNHNGPVIFAGDFNTWNSWRMDDLNSIMQERGLKHITSRNPILSTLDHIYIRGLDALSFKTLYNIKSSDHSPLIAKLRLSKNK